MKTTSFRLDEKDLERIEKLAEEEGEGKSQTVRDLLGYGWEYLKIRQYRKGEISLSRIPIEVRGEYVPQGMERDVFLDTRLFGILFHHFCDYLGLSGSPCKWF